MRPAGRHRRKRYETALHPGHQQPRSLHHFTIHRNRAQATTLSARFSNNPQKVPVNAPARNLIRNRQASKRRSRDNRHRHNEKGYENTRHRLTKDQD